MATFHETVKAILDAIVESIKESADSGDLSGEGIKTVVRGNRARPLPQMPAIWVVPQPANFTQEDYGEESWAMPISIAALVKSDSPETGEEIALRIASLARDAALAARPDGSSDVDVNVTDIVAQSFDPLARNSERNRNLYWVEAVIRATFSVDQ